MSIEYNLYFDKQDPITIADLVRICAGTDFPPDFEDEPFAVRVARNVHWKFEACDVVPDGPVLDGDVICGCPLPRSSSMDALLRSPNSEAIDQFFGAVNCGLARITISHDFSFATYFPRVANSSCWNFFGGCRGVVFRIIGRSRRSGCVAAPGFDVGGRLVP